MEPFLPNAITRFLYSVPMAVFGFYHFFFTDTRSEAVPEFIPGARYWVYLVGIALMAACVFIIWGKWARTFSYVLGILLLIFSFSIWLPQVQQEVKQVEFFLKELSLAGAAFFIGNHSSD